MAKRNYNNSRRSNRDNFNKKSGCKVAIIQSGKNEGEKCLVGWNASKTRGLVTFLATPYKNSDSVHQSRSGKEYSPWMCTVVFKRTGEKRTVSCLYEHGSGKVRIPDMGIVMNPHAGNGGYCGQSKRP